ncbi:MAG: hypothetical protein AAFR96_12280 [Planctomycetota bacterium]
MLHDEDRSSRRREVYHETLLKMHERCRVLGVPFASSMTLVLDAVLSLSDVDLRRLFEGSAGLQVIDGLERSPGAGEDPDA